MLISSICLPMITEANQVNLLGPNFILMYLPCAILATSNHLLKDDLEDGSLDFTLLHHSATDIVLTKLIGVSLLCIGSILCCAPFFCIFFDLSITSAFRLISCASIISIYTTSICIFISCVSIAIDANKPILSSLLIPLLIPEIIVCGMFMQTTNYSFMEISFGLLVICTTVMAFFASTLLAHIEI